jgi:oxygen-independent coproporphyrinogen-3 oxidase
MHSLVKNHHLSSHHLSSHHLSSHHLSSHHLNNHHLNNHHLNNHRPPNTEQMRGLYLHIPFCSKKCIYCDFYSLETTQHIGVFVETLVQEIRLRSAMLSPEQHRVNTVFFGGGTPSLLTVQQMERIIEELHKHFQFTGFDANAVESSDESTEWTMECNPGTVTVESLMGYKSLGINRLSFGVQSFFASDLEFLSRIHSRSEAVQAVETARKAGFDNINLDLMFALPNQTLEHWQANVQTALALETEHVSAYSLIFEEGTPLNAMKLRGEVRPQSDDDDAALYEWTMEAFAKHGYEHYEVSNFCKPHKHCRHNTLYWQGEEYVAFGPSAHGYLVHSAGTLHERYWNVRSLKRYSDMVAEQTLPVVNHEHLGRREQLFERAFLELRSRGIRLAEFQRDFDIDLCAVLAPLFAKYDGEHFLRVQHGRLSLTARGYVLCDAISADVITALERYVGEPWENTAIP